MSLKGLAEVDPLLAGRLAILRLLLIDRSISMRQVAIRMNVNVMVVSRVLNGVHPNPNRWLDLIDDAINVISIERGITYSQEE